MATRYPLVIDVNDNNKIKELPDGDQLNLSGNDIVNVINITASGKLTVNSIDVDSLDFRIDGQELDVVAFTGNYNDLSQKPALFSGSYLDLTNKPPIKTTIESLDNVADTLPSQGQILKYDNILGKYTPTTIPEISGLTINDLLDVNIQNISADPGQVLKWDGDHWVRGPSYSGLAADTLDGFEGDYYLDYDNFNNVPNIFSTIVDDAFNTIDVDDYQMVSILGSTNINTSIVNNNITISLDPIIVSDFKGSLFGDDSTLLVDGVRSSIPASVLEGALPALDGSLLFNLPPGGGNSSYFNYSVDTTNNLLINDLQPLKSSNNDDLSLGFFITAYTKMLIELHGWFASETDSSQEPILLLQRRLNNGSWVDVQNVIAGSVELNNSGNYVQIQKISTIKIIDTHSGSYGDFIEYRFINNTNGFLGGGANDIRQYFANAGASTTMIIQEI